MPRWTVQAWRIVPTSCAPEWRTNLKWSEEVLSTLEMFLQCFSFVFLKPLAKSRIYLLKISCWCVYWHTSLPQYVTWCYIYSIHLHRCEVHDGQQNSTLPRSTLLLHQILGLSLLMSFPDSLVLPFFSPKARFLDEIVPKQGRVTFNVFNCTQIYIYIYTHSPFYISIHLDVFL